MGSLSEKQLRAIEDTERACSVLSLLGTAFIIRSFLYCDSFRKPINRLVFFASWGNVLSNVATLISRSGIFSGVTGPLCQFQGFLLQWSAPPCWRIMAGLLTDMQVHASRCSVDVRDGMQRVPDVLPQI